MAACTWQTFPPGGGGEGRGRVKGAGWVGVRSIWKLPATSGERLAQPPAAFHTLLQGTEHHNPSHHHSSLISEMHSSCDLPESLLQFTLGILILGQNTLPIRDNCKGEEVQVWGECRRRHFVTNTQYQILLEKYESIVTVW